ncbi:threonine dehydratase [Alteromonas oceanisediminis]|uniref:threonine dehydratase n=1 Tax=Alteromonas oceanisediminis TaxID=2836180 RepID=UPI001BD974BA|nr:threonine dehydratase [Alteromonas oceanisediminis]MBT0586203.1 threonine dehydratase [Alteromonas oceanisediminis]
MFSLAELEAAKKQVYGVQPPTPQYQWPLLSAVVGTELWVKHENHTATGAFKIRGGITFMHWLRSNHPNVKGIVTATRGNHGQSQARAAKALGLSATIVVPHGNSSEKNQAMQAFGATVVVHGNDFDAARLRAKHIAETQGLFLVPPFHAEIVKGVASYALELFDSVDAIDTVYVPIGCGSGICGLIAARDALGLDTQIVGVVSTAANAAKRSFESGVITETGSANTFADGMAVRAPIAESFAMYRAGAARIVEVSDDEVANAIRAYFRCTHNVAEGAGAAALAAAIQEKEQLSGKRVAVILCGGNIDTSVFAEVLSGITPKVTV